MNHRWLALSLPHILVLLVGLYISSCQESYAASEKNNIYLFDCTGSMIKNSLWDPARNTLDISILSQSEIPDSYFTVIPFGDKPYEEFSFTSNQYASQKGDINKAFEKYIRQANYTRISDVLQAGFAKIDPAKENRIYLLTDGQPNGGDSPEKVARTIAQWCSNHTNTRLFYVALTPDAINQKIKDAIDECPDAYVLVCNKNVIPQVTDMSQIAIYANIIDLPSDHRLQFSLPGKKPLNIDCSDPIFNAELIGGGAVDGIITLRLSSKGNLNSEALHEAINNRIGSNSTYTFPLYITSPDPDSYFVINPQVTVYMDDHLQTNLTLLDGTGDEFKAEDCQWHDAFLWSDASEPASTEIDLQPNFKNINGPTKCSFLIEPAHGQPVDYTLYFNDVQIPSNESIDIIPNKPAVIRIVFEPNAKTGKRYFLLKPHEMIGVDLINGNSLDQYEGQSLRTKYTENWNPLKTICFWIGIILLILLALWFAMIRRIIYPTIKVARIELFNSKGYYQSTRIKGKIKVVLTSKRKSQNTFSRVFCGNIGYVRADLFYPEIEIMPGSKKKIRFASKGTKDNKWVFTPSSILAPYEKAHAEKEANAKESFDVETS